MPVQRATVSIMALVIGWLAGTSGLAADFPAEDPKPFAEARVLLQLSDRDEAKQSIVLDVANNLIKHYGGPDMIDIEIVAFGPGIDLLFAGNARAERIDSLAVSGVRFVACMNTVDTVERITGKRPELSSHAIGVQTGVAHIVSRGAEGYTLVRP